MTDEAQGKTTKRWGVIAVSRLGNETIHQVSSIHRFKVNAWVELASMRRVHEEWLDTGLPSIIERFEVGRVLV